MEILIECWSVSGRFWQVYPGTLDDRFPWRVRPEWLLVGGRGTGKTRTGAEWVLGLVAANPYIAPERVRRIALVGETLSDARVMVEGPAAILACYARRSERPFWPPTLRKL